MTLNRSLFFLLSSLFEVEILWWQQLCDLSYPDQKIVDRIKYGIHDPVHNMSKAHMGYRIPDQDCQGPNLQLI